jgi:glutaredoxin-like protein NrdH
MSFPIKIYTLSTCSHCKAAKKFLNDCGASYDCIELDLLAGEERVNILNEVLKLNPQASFPTILIGDEVIAGFQEQRIKKILGL